MSEQEPLVKELDGNTVFTFAYFCNYTNGATGQTTMRSAVGMWGWEDVDSVSTFETDVMPNLPEPRSSFIWQGNYVYLNVPCKTLAVAWLR